MTTLTLLLEPIDKSCIAHVKELFGCFSVGANEEAAVENAGEAVEDYVKWCQEREPDFSVSQNKFAVGEKFAPRKVGERRVTAFFEVDRVPLTEEDVAEAQKLLGWTRESLLRSTLGLHASDLRLPLRGERWPILGVLEHVADTENWFLAQFEHELPSEALGEDAFHRLSATRKRFSELLPELVGDDRVFEREGHTWSPRKIARRALWHERDHTFHIRKMRAQLES